LLHNKRTEGKSVSLRQGVLGRSSLHAEDPVTMGHFACIVVLAVDLMTFVVVHIGHMSYNYFVIML